MSRVVFAIIAGLAVTGAMALTLGVLLARIIALNPANQLLVWFAGALLIAFPGITLAVLIVHRPLNSLPNHCRKCGYDLTGNTSGRCPECGYACDDD